MDIKISIVVPIYNVEDYLVKCIESIIKQSYGNLEIILVDDGSTDSCPGICDRYAKMDERIKVIHKTNGGVVSARKAGTAAATGDYILNVDGDDWIEEERINTLVVDGIRPSWADMIHMAGHKRDFKGKSYHLVNSNMPTKIFQKEEIQTQVFPLLQDVHKAFCYTAIGLLCMWAFRRELIQNTQKLVDDGIWLGEDSVCVCSCLLAANSVAIIKESGYHYVQREDSAVYRSASREDALKQMRLWYQMMNKQLQIHRATKEITAICIHHAVNTIMAANYGLLMGKNAEYLYPFPKVKKGSRIVVYGAGRMGCGMMRYLIESNDYPVVLWVDQNLDRPALPGHTVCPVESIAKVDYDYIAIAVLDASVAEEIRESLLRMGVPQEKIAAMDASVIAEDAIPDEIKTVQQ